MLEYAENNLPESIWQQHDGEELLSMQEEWTDAYYKEQKIKLEKNFSKERLDLLCNMTKHRYAETIKYREIAEKERQKAELGTKTISPKQIGSTAAVVGAVIAGAGIIASSTAVTTVGATVAIGGVVLFAVNAKKK